MPASKVYLGVIDGVPVVHLGVAPKPKGKTVETRGARFVVMPEWQGLGFGLKFRNYVAQLQMEGKGIMPGKCVTHISTTSHPGLCRAYRRDPKWQQITAPLHGQRQATTKKSLKKRNAAESQRGFEKFGGHWRSVQAFRYIGENPKPENIVTNFRKGGMYDRIRKNTASPGKAQI